MSAAAALQAAAVAAVKAAGGMNGVFAGPPVQGSVPYAVVDAGAESDWGHKSGEGREVRLAVTVFERGEAPAGLRARMDAAEAAVAALAGEIGGWRLVTIRFVRSRVAPPAAGAPDGRWAGTVEFRARLLAA